MKSGNVKSRMLLLGALIVLSVILAFGFMTLPKPRPLDTEGFSSARVAEDIEVISREPHSVAHPVEREKVREYIDGRLEEMDAEIHRYQFDSLPGPPVLGEYYFDAVNLVADFAPLSPENDVTYLMFVAHYDSRHVNHMPDGPSVSFGAADDGYGVGVILETVSCLLEHREQWKQGVRILFTDAEETKMTGMKMMWEHERHVFKDVGLIINVEARGPWGPALMFETSPGNERIMDLYTSSARYPHTYSLTNVVYDFLPNLTDFTIVKDEVPGLNFSTVADYNHYHTALDNFSNISERSIQHYGEQILPVALNYLRNPEYADKDYFKAERSTVNFSIPVLGLFNVGKTAYAVMNILIFLLFVILCTYEAKRGNLRILNILKHSGLMLLAAVSVLVSGEMIGYLCATIAGDSFSLFGVVQGAFFDNKVMLVSTIILTALTGLIYCFKRRNSQTRSYAYEWLFGILVLESVLSILLLVTVGENMMFLIPLFFACMALLLCRITSWNAWIPLSIAGILLHACSFLYVLAMALTVGAFGIVAMLSLLDLLVIIPLSDIYIKENDQDGALRTHCAIQPMCMPSRSVVPDLTDGKKH